MAKKLRKMLGTADSPYIVSLMRLIETQSKVTVANWCMDYAETHMLPLFQKHFPVNKPYNSLQNGPKNTLKVAREFLAGKTPFYYAKNIILNSCHYPARELGDNPIAQAAARACGQACSSVHVPTHALAFCFYAAAALAYDRVGLDETPEVYNRLAAEECAKMETALRAVAVEDEPNPAKYNWNC
ncbi:MAG: hypothetical protein FWF10_06320 [Clostridiales bacterium]|nr:hypothetical protein [Clostridiales bacterium]